MSPADFLIGLRELLGHLVPGAAFLLILPLLWPRTSEPLLPTLQDSIFWPKGEAALFLIFLMAAYAIGTLLSGVSTRFDRLAERCAAIKIHLPLLRKKWTKQDAEFRRLKELVEELQNQITGSLTAGESQFCGLRAFWWAFLRARCPAVLAEADKLAAQQKLFRSLFPGALLLALLSLFKDGQFVPFSSTPADAWITVALLGFALISFAAFAELRQELTRRLYLLALSHFLDERWQGARVATHGDASVQLSLEVHE
jgi:hypothetical protein